ncbi:MAG: hypothetical protein J1E28_07005 [Helicobacter sp.]|uniref:hypothetical protein n=1 Tax=Helicobacter sp. TaxID=218 RepID=UPI0025B85903|nr:hypothetical protein [Helicobacter sp.]MCH5314120.1 hypothetical protein [Helicobacter sp.]
MHFIPLHSYWAIHFIESMPKALNTDSIKCMRIQYDSGFDQGAPHLCVGAVVWTRLV